MLKKGDHNIDMKIKYIKILVLLFVNFFLIGAGIITYQKIQEKNAIKNYTQEFSKVTREERAKAKNTVIQKGMVGENYLEAYYPKIDGEPIGLVRDRILADVGELPQEVIENKQPQKLLFYHTELLTEPFVGVHPYQINRIRYKWKNDKFISEKSEKLSLLYLDDSGNAFQFTQLFTDSDAVKEILLIELRSQLVFLQLSEERIEEVLQVVSESDMASWGFTYEKGTFLIDLPVEIEGMGTFDVPLSKLYDVIDIDRLQPEDLKGYEAYQEQRNKKMVALTFDDGPDPSTTPQALEILKRYGVKGTFFMLGKNVAAYPEVVKKVHKEGHEIGIHTWDHPILTNLPLDDVEHEIMDTQDIIQKVTGIQTKITRPPYGSINSAVQYAVDQSFIMWDVDTLDWKTHNTDAILQEIKNEVSPGSIILMHDIHQTSIDALPTVIEYLQSQGYDLVTVNELLDHKVDSHHIYYRKN